MTDDDTSRWPPRRGGPPAGPPSGPLNAPAPPPPRRRPALLPVLAGLLALAVALVGVLAGTGVLGGRDSGGGPPPGGTSVSAPPPRTTAAGALGFGRTQRHADGVEVSVSAPTRFTPSSAAAGHTAGHVAVTVEITVTNGSDARLELATVQVRGRDGAGREASRVFDAGPDLGLGLTGTLLPGRRAVAAHGFDLPPRAADVLDVEVTVGFDREAGVWSGPVP
jgi:hypothetical protein